MLSFNKKDKSNSFLEEKIIDYIHRAEKYLNEIPFLGTIFLNEANRLYNELGYNFKIETKINQAFFKYMNKDLQNKN